MPVEFAPAPLRSEPSCSEWIRRFRYLLDQAARQYKQHPCAVPGCPSIITRLGFPQADVAIRYNPGGHDNRTIPMAAAGVIRDLMPFRPNDPGGGHQTFDLAESSSDLLSSYISADKLKTWA